MSSARRNWRWPSSTKRSRPPGAAARPVVIAGAELDAVQAEKLAALKGKAAMLTLLPAANSAEAAVLGLKNGLSGKQPGVAYVMAGEASLTAEEIAALRQADCLVVQAGVHSALTAAADVVLPAPLWFEREGSFTSLEGKKLAVKPAAAPPAGIPGEKEILERLATTL